MEGGVKREFQNRQLFVFRQAILQNNDPYVVQILTVLCYPSMVVWAIGNVGVQGGGVIRHAQIRRVELLSYHSSRRYSPERPRWPSPGP